MGIGASEDISTIGGGLSENMSCLLFQLLNKFMKQSYPKHSAS